MAVDRLASLHVFHPLARLFGLHRSSIPVLMYHSISSERLIQPTRYFEVNTEPEIFERQMRFLKNEGYRSVTLKDLSTLISPETGPWQERYVSITFDDGYKNFYTEAFPVLKRFGLTATVFLPTAFVGGPRSLSWDDIRELIDEGIDFGSHTVNHLQMRFLCERSLRKELDQSKKEIEDRTGHPVDSFSYPFAFPDQDRKLKKVLKTALTDYGYRAGLIGMVGTVRKGDDPMFLKRLPVDSHDGEGFFRVKLEGGYNWFRLLQRARKLGQLTREEEVECSR